MVATKNIELALQGGGSHGAYTWGILDKFLQDDRIEIAAISGTRAGAMNAVALADGLTRGARDAAREALDGFWRAVSSATQLSPINPGPIDQMFSRGSLDASPGHIGMNTLERLASPYQLNPFELNPLRDVLEKQVDFDQVKACSATNVRTGLPRVFRQGEITLDVVMASAYLPDMFKAIEIDDEAYWDGGFIGNPTLSPLVDESDRRDMVIVQISPIRHDKVPTTATEIRDRMNEITFNSSLVKKLRSIALLQRIIGGEGLEHLPASSKMNTGLDFLLYLHDLSRKSAKNWIKAKLAGPGERSIFDPETLFVGYFQPPGAHKCKDKGAS